MGEDSSFMMLFVSLSLKDCFVLLFGSVKGYLLYSGDLSCLDLGGSPSLSKTGALLLCTPYFLEKGFDYAYSFSCSLIIFLKLLVAPPTSFSPFFLAFKFYYNSVLFVFP